MLTKESRVICPFSSGLKEPPKSLIAFKNLKSCYSTSEIISIDVLIPSEAGWKETDWVGLFPMGWSNLQQYLTFEWVSEAWNVEPGRSEIKILTMQFRPQFHSFCVSENNYYQFVYVSRQIEVLGTSSTFRFHITPWNQKDVPELSYITSSRSTISKSSFSVDVVSIPVAEDNQSQLKLVLTRNKTLEEKVALLEKELRHAKEDNKKSEELISFLSKKKRINQNFLKDLIDALEVKDTVKVVYGRTEMTIKKVQKMERPKSINGCQTMTKVDFKQLRGISVVPAFMNDLCWNIKENLKCLGIPWKNLNIRRNDHIEESGGNLQTDHPSSTPESESDTARMMNNTEELLEVEELDIKTNESEESISIDSDKKDEVINELNGNENLLISYIPTTSFIQQRVLDIKQLLELVGRNINLVNTKWLQPWIESRNKSNAIKSNQVAPKVNQEEKRVQIKFIIPVTQRDINTLLGEKCCSQEKMCQHNSGGGQTTQGAKVIEMTNTMGEAGDAGCPSTRDENQF